MNVSIAHLEDALSLRRWVNRQKLRDIEWSCCGEDVPITEKEYQDWEMCGLLNTDFYEMIILEKLKEKSK